MYVLGLAHKQTKPLIRAPNLVIQIIEYTFTNDTCTLTKVSKLKQTNTTPLWKQSESQPTLNYHLKI